MPITMEKVEGHIAVITIDNGRLNLATPDMHRQLAEHLREFNQDSDIRVGILKGSSGGSFCAGSDLKAVRARRSPGEQLDAHLFPAHSIEDTTEEYWDQQILLSPRNKPIIAAADGWCLGQGMIFFLMLSELRICTREARFGMPEIAYGYAGGGGMTQLGKQIPPSTALWMLLTGDPIDAAEALRIHLVNKVVEPDELMNSAMKVARQIAALPPASVSIELDAFRRSMDLGRDDAVRYAMNLYRMQVIAGVPDSIVPAFMDKKALPSA